MESIRNREGSEFTAVPERKPLVDTFDAIEHVAKSLIHDGTVIERQLLLKSLQETLFVTADFQTGLSYGELLRRIRRKIQHDGAEVLLQRFLSFHFFNVVWFQTGESFRALAPTSAALEKDMTIVEKLCETAVAHGWRFREPKRPILDPAKAQKLVRTIEDHLRGAAN
jgi:hypothetical protein